mgnify:CR=1 FL=1
MIGDDLKWLKDNMKFKRGNAIFSDLTPCGIFAIYWVTSIGLRLFLNHFEAKI